MKVLTIRNVFLVCVSIASYISIDVIGKILLSEVAVLIAFPFCDTLGLFKRHPLLRRLVACLSALLFTQVVSDIVNETEAVDFLRGWAAIVFPMLSIIVYVKWFESNRHSVPFLLLGAAIGGYFLPEEALDWSTVGENSNYFKERYVGFICPLVLLIGYLIASRRPKVVGLVYICIGFFLVFMDARSVGATFICAGTWIGLLFSHRKLSSERMLAAVSCLVPLLYGVYIVYVDQVLEKGFGGLNAYAQLSNATNPYNPFSLLLQGRPEFVVLLQAGWDRPLLGHGSWAKDPGGQYAFLQAEITRAASVDTFDRIRAHSVAMGYWAYSGIIGLMSVTVLYLSLIAAAFRIIKSKANFSITAVLVPLTMMEAWAFLFSPIGQVRKGLPLIATIVIFETRRISQDSRLSRTVGRPLPTAGTEFFRPPGSGLSV
jgi:hypothetical protein